MAASTINPLRATLIVAVAVLIVQWLLPSSLEDPSDLRVNCADLIHSELREPASRGQQRDPVRFAPHSYDQTVVDSDPAFATPQVFRVLATVKSDNAVIVQHCQAIYTDVAASFGDDKLEMPAHCFFSASAGMTSSERAEANYPGVNKDTGKVSVNEHLTAPQPPEVNLGDYCVYMGANLNQPDAILGIKEIACKSDYSDLHLKSVESVLINDSCLVTLTEAVPETIRQSPLRWWFPDPSSAYDGFSQFQTLLAVRPLRPAEFSVATTVYGQKPLYMVSHSIDNDGKGRRRVVSSGRSIYKHRVENVIMSLGVIPNNIDTRSGDSGSAIFVRTDSGKALLGMQVAVMAGYTRHLPSVEMQQRDKGYANNYNVAVHPHIAPAAVEGFPYVYRTRR